MNFIVSQIMQMLSFLHTNILYPQSNYSKSSSKSKANGNIFKYFRCEPVESTKAWQKRAQARILRIIKAWVGNFSGMLKRDNDFKFVFGEFVESDANYRNEQIFKKFLVIF
jgi:hypothetical protein